MRLRRWRAPAQNAHVKNSPPTALRRVAARPAKVAAAAAPAGPVRAMRIVRAAGEAVLRLDDGERYVVGRHDAADVVFDGDDVSRLHGVLRHDDGRWWFEDYGSSNGSVVVRVGGGSVDVEPHRPIALGPGDRVELGGAQAVLEALAEPPAADDDRRVDVERSAAARAFAEKVRLAGRTRVPVFLLGPSGVGKTFTARRIHELSGAPGPFVPVNCARLPVEPTALHSELLGHVKGAYTGADTARPGKLVVADGGTLFLDEVESLPPLAQGFLLDVLEGSGDLAPLGAAAVKLKPATFRLVSASKAPLARSGLRPDLCERLAEGHLWRVPTLDERKDDVPALVRRFAAEQAAMLGVAVVVDAGFTDAAKAARWPGQIRQLRACVVVLAQLGLAKQDGARRQVALRAADLQRWLDERADAFGDGVVDGEDLGDGIRVKADARALTKGALQRALDEAGGSKARAARALGIARNTLSRKARDFGL